MNKTKHLTIIVDKKANKSEIINYYKIYTS